MEPSGALRSGHPGKEQARKGTTFIIKLARAEAVKAQAGAKSTEVDQFLPAAARGG